MRHCLQEANCLRLIRIIRRDVPLEVFSATTVRKLPTEWRSIASSTAKRELYKVDVTRESNDSTETSDSSDGVGAIHRYGQSVTVDSDFDFVLVHCSVCSKYAKCRFAGKLFSLSTTNAQSARRTQDSHLWVVLWCEDVMHTLLKQYLNSFYLLTLAINITRRCPFYCPHTSTNEPWLACAQTQSSHQHCSCVNKKRRRD